MLKAYAVVSVGVKTTQYKPQKRGSLDFLLKKSIAGRGTERLWHGVLCPLTGWLHLPRRRISSTIISGDLWMRRGIRQIIYRAIGNAAQK
jgi:hypothetical protein